MMLRIPAFRDDFINRYADLLNTQLQPEQTVTALEELVAGIAPVMSRHDNRWGSWGSWDSETSGVRQWLSERNWHATSHIVDNFGLAGVWTLELDVDPPGSGTFMLTTVEVDAPFAGTYFLGVPMTVTAVPAPGFSFAGWSDPNLPGSATVTLEPPGPVQLTASFQ
jgi:hypothetical protein